MTPAAPLLRLTHLSKRFGTVTAVKNVNLEVFSGDFLAIFGPNGAGKTTLLRIMASLTSPSEGAVEFLTGNRTFQRERVGYVSHQSLLYNELTGLENLLFYARIYSVEEAGPRALRMLEEMGLKEAGDRLVREYSRGMKQRLTLARALLHNPDLLLLDEPYTGLDQHGGRVLTDVLSRLRREGRTVVLITHNITEGLQLSTRLTVQHRGRLVFHASREEVSASEFERIYFDVVKG